MHYERSGASGEPLNPVEHRLTLNLLGITEEELARFQDRLRRVRGHIRIAVHPRYINRWPGTFFGAGTMQKGTDVGKRIESGFISTARSVVRNTNSSPLLVFEGLDELDDTRNLVSESVNADPEELAGNGIFFFPTENNRGQVAYCAIDDAYAAVSSFPEPTFGRLLSERDLYITEMLDLDARRKQKLTETMLKDLADYAVRASLRTLGVRSALLMGSYFVATPRPSTSDGNILNACAGSVAQFLRDMDIRSDMSRFSWLPPEEIRRVGVATKETGISR